MYVNLNSNQRYDGIETRFNFKEFILLCKREALKLNFFFKLHQNMYEVNKICKIRCIQYIHKYTRIYTLHT